METLITFLGPHIRKWIFGLSLVWIVKVCEWASANNVPITQLDFERWIEMIVALGLMGIVAFYTWAKNKFAGQTPVVVPNAAVPEVKAIVAEAK